MKKLIVLIISILCFIGCSSEPTGGRLVNSFLTELRKTENIEINAVAMKIGDPEQATANYPTHKETEQLGKLEIMLHGLIYELNKDWRNKAEVQYYSTFAQIVNSVKNNVLTYKQASLYQRENDERLARIYSIRDQVYAEQAAMENARYQSQLMGFQRNNQRIMQYYQNRADNRPRRTMTDCNSLGNQVFCSSTSY